MTIVAICPVENLAANNAALAAAGWGPSNFSVAIYTNNVRATHATLHSWDIPGFQAALAGLPGVVATNSTTSEPKDRVSALITARGLVWPENAPVLPNSGIVRAGEFYRYIRGTATDEFWRVIQQHNRNIFGGDPRQYSALIRQVRIPGVVSPWVQPLDQFDAYKVVDPFTGEGEKASHNGSVWRVTQGDGAGNNVWEPGVFGWVVTSG